ncbi:DNA glycosylase AlkZ-like family protein [Streptomyces niveus]|uniref:DNA glycosylase AlkZ-like family protein n=1 Tax=Streptomyces niveus TaxID=193462 RepID=UPI0036B83360
MTGPPPHRAVALSPAEARHLAVTAALPPGGLPGPAAVLEHLRIVQIDAISTLARAHHLTLATRIPGATTTAADTALAQEPRPPAFDYPAHALSLVPVTDWPLWAFRRRAARRHPQYPEAALRATILQHIAHHGPSPLRALRRPGEAGGGWGWGPTKTAVEILGWAGELACTRRTGGGHRLFDLPDRCIPGHLLTDRATDDECQRTLLTHAGRVLAVATADDLADYLRIHPQTVTRLLPTTPLVPATVGQWDKPAWAHPTALTPPGEPRPQPALFLGPFDNLLWHRPRARRLFTFTHLFEAYKPADRRTHGYYVCPLLADGRLIGRADLTRHDNALTVLHASFEDHAGPDAHSHFARASHHMATLTTQTHTLIADDAAEPALVTALRTALTEPVTP